MSGSAGERFGFLQAVTQQGDTCTISAWLVDQGKLRPMGFTYGGEFKAEHEKEPKSCVFPLADGDIPEAEMVDGSGPMHINLIFELGQQTYFVQHSTGSEGFTTTLFRLNNDKLEEVVAYYDYVIDHNFWKSTGEPSSAPAEVQ